MIIIMNLLNLVLKMNKLSIDSFQLRLLKEINKAKVYQNMVFSPISILLHYLFVSRKHHIK